MRATRLRLLRMALGLSQEDVATKASMDRRFVGLAENGRYRPTIHEQEALAGALNWHGPAAELLDVLTVYPMTEE